MKHKKKKAKGLNVEPSKIMRENIIHIKLEKREAIQIKEDILSSEINVLRIARIMRAYHLFRMDELNIKMKLYEKINETKTSINKLQKILPKIRVPEILRKNLGKDEARKIKEKRTMEIGEGEVREKTYDEGIDAQLREIQEKLASLQR